MTTPGVDTLLIELVKGPSKRLCAIWAIYWLGNTPETTIKNALFPRSRVISKDEAIPILIRTARNHPRMDIRKHPIRVLGQTGDERATAFFNELLSK
jgi:hypothetical protein